MERGNQAAVVTCTGGARASPGEEGKVASGGSETGRKVIDVEVLSFTEKQKAREARLPKQGGNYQYGKGGKSP